MRIKNFFRASCLCAAAFSVLAINSCCTNTQTEEGRAKYIFVMIGDGMGASHVAATESYLSYKAGKLGGEQLCFSKFPVLGLCTTYSADERVTDSAAAGTAIATGHKTLNGMIGMNPDTVAVYSMASALKEAGYKVGIMSSVPVNHATPAAFYGHQKDRKMYYEISLQIPESGFEFFAGSGILDFNGKNDDLEDIDAVLEREGYDVCYGLAELEDNTGTEGVVVIPASQRKKDAANYEITREEEAKEDRLGEVLAAAISYLGDEEPFFIMCEGGEIDWAAHDNNVMSMNDAVLRFNEAVQVAYDFYLAHPDETLIVVTADHETGGIALGADAKAIDWAGLEAAYPDVTARIPEEENRRISARHNIGWTSFNHTGAPVPVYAIGKGAGKFAGRIDNTDIYGKVVAQ